MRLPSKAIAINDFRYLAPQPERIASSTGRTPSTHAFDRRALNRKYRSPLNAFPLHRAVRGAKGARGPTRSTSRGSQASTLGPHQTNPAHRTDRKALLDAKWRCVSARARCTVVTIDGAKPSNPILARIHFLETRSSYDAEWSPPDEPDRWHDERNRRRHLRLSSWRDFRTRSCLDVGPLRRTCHNACPRPRLTRLGPMPSTYLTPKKIQSFRWKNFLKNAQLSGRARGRPLCESRDPTSRSCSWPPSRPSRPCSSLFFAACETALVGSRCGRGRASSASCWLAAGWLMRPFGTVRVRPSGAPADALRPRTPHRRFTLFSTTPIAPSTSATRNWCSTDCSKRVSPATYWNSVYLEMRSAASASRTRAARGCAMRQVVAHRPHALKSPRRLRERSRYRAALERAPGRSGIGATPTFAPTRTTLASRSRESDGRWKISDVQILEEQRVPSPR